MMRQRVSPRGSVRVAGPWLIAMLLLVAPVIAWILCVPKYLGGTMSLGEAAQVVAAFVMVQAALNWLVDNYPGLAECLSSVNRVSALLVAMDELDEAGVGQAAGRETV